MPTAEELIVAIKSEGVSETRSELNGVSQEMQETAETAGDSAENLEGFSNRFEGAIAAATAALAVAAVGLASQVPVVGEAFSGLGAIVQAVAFQMDKVLRPILSPLGKALFGVSEFIFEAEGALGTFIGVVSTGATIIAGLLVALGTAAGAFLALGGSMSTLVTIGATVLGAIGLIVTAIASLPATVVAAIAAIAAFATAFIFNIGGIRDKTFAIFGRIWEFVSTGFNNLTSTLATWADGLASDMFEWGKQAIQRFIDGLKSLIDRVRNILSDLGTDVRVALGGDASVDTGRTGGGTSNPMMRGASGGSGSVNLDGRKMTEDTGRYRSDASLRRGL